MQWTLKRFLDTTLPEPGLRNISNVLMQTVSVGRSFEVIYNQKAKIRTKLKFKLFNINRLFTETVNLQTEIMNNISKLRVEEFLSLVDCTKIAYRKF